MWLKQGNLYKTLYENYVIIYKMVKMFRQQASDGFSPSGTADIIYIIGRQEFE